MLIYNAALDGILLIIPADCVKVSSRCKVEEGAPQQSALHGLPHDRLYGLRLMRFPRPRSKQPRLTASLLTAGFVGSPRPCRHGAPLFALLLAGHVSKGQGRLCLNLFRSSFGAMLG